MARARSAATDTVDWRAAHVGDLQDCVACGQPALLRHPVTRRPHHKVCDQAKTAAELERAAAAYTGAA